MIPTSRIRYGVREDSLNKFKKTFGAYLSGVIWQPTKLKDEGWWILTPTELSQAVEHLSLGSGKKMDFRYFAEPVLLVNIESDIQKKKDFTFYLPRDSEKDEVEAVLRHYQGGQQGEIFL